MYVGQTSQSLKRRWSRHKSYSKRGCPYLSNAIKKYGEGSFLIEPLVFIETKKEADFYESKLIKFLDLKNPCKGYNLTNGGEGTLGYIRTSETLKRMSENHWTKFKKVSEESRLKMSESAKGNKNWLGKKHTLESKIKMSKSQKQRVVSEETKKKISSSSKGKVIPDIVRIKISNSLKGRKYKKERVWKTAHSFHLKNGKINNLCIFCEG